MQRYLTVPIRSFASSSDKYRNYLETWIGSKPSTVLNSDQSRPPSSSSFVNQNVLQQRKQQTQQQQQQQPVSSPSLMTNVSTSLILKGTSYLLPTLRLERSEDTETLRRKIHELFTSARLSGVSSMLRGMPTESSSSSSSILSSLSAASCNQTISTWYVPIVLDLSALTPDGSHHYQPPEVGRLVGVVNVLRDFGIVVVGVSHVPSILESEAIQTLGLPLFQPKVGGGGGGSILRSTSAIPLEDVLPLIWRKRLQSIPDVLDSLHPTVDDNKEITTSSEMNTNFHDPSKLEAKKDVNSSEHSGSIMIPIDHSTETAKSSNVEVEASNDMFLPISEQPLDQSQSPTPMPPVPPPPPSNAFVYHGSVRSGQQVAAEEGQALIVIGSVNSGGEVLSHGDIYIFGKLRGRALAGLTYPKDAKIIATSFDPELICIGDTFTTVDTVHDLGLKCPEASAMVTLSDGGDLVVQEITL
jgi:septum site-determining protein MinC